MAVSDFIKLIKKEIFLVVAVIAIFVLAGFAFKVWFSRGYTVKLDINITRAGSQETTEYRYDEYYRLQADEKYAETVSKWLADANVSSLILKQAKMDSANLSIRKLSHYFSAEKLSSQFISVKFGATNESEAKRISASITKVLQEKNKQLNDKQQDQEWFEIMVGSPLVRKNYVSSGVVLLFSLSLGVFASLWCVMIKQYVFQDENRD